MPAANDKPKLNQALIERNNVSGPGETVRCSAHRMSDKILQAKFVPGCRFVSPTCCPSHFLRDRSRSRTTSSARLSPLILGRDIRDAAFRPALVHSVNLTSATNDCLTQVVTAFDPSPSRANGDLAVLSGRELAVQILDSSVSETLCRRVRCISKRYFHASARTSAPKNGRDRWAQ